MILIIVLIVIVSILLVLVVLAQNSKGGGLSSQFGGAGASNMIGVKKTSDLLEKITWGLAITLFVLAISSKFVGEASRSAGKVNTPSIERAQKQNTTPPLDLGAEEVEEEPIEENDNTSTEENEEPPSTEKETTTNN